MSKLKCIRESLRSVLSGESKSQIFWSEVFSGQAKGGYYFRSDLKMHFDKLKASKLRPVGIVYNDSPDVEILVEELSEN